MISHQTLAGMMLAAYEYKGFPHQGEVTPYPYEWQAQLDKQAAGYVHMDGAVVILIPGTETLYQWRLDFSAWAEEYHHDIFGKIHAGFWTGVEEWTNALVASLGKLPNLGHDHPVYVVGHSAGAARNQLVAALLITKGYRIAEVVSFEPPRVGMAQFKTWSDNCYMPRTFYANQGATEDSWVNHDFVVDVPVYIPLLAPYAHTTDLTWLLVDPLPKDPWGAFRFHHMALCAKALGVKDIPSSVLAA